MSEILEVFRAAPLWDSRSDLPLFPTFNNPWIYGAYALKIMRHAGLTLDEELSLVKRFEEHAAKCRIAPGLFDRWPGGSGGVFSHDEIIGMAYISAPLAAELLEYLETTDGVYCNKPEDVPYQDPSFRDRYNVFRIVQLKPFLQARAPTRHLGLPSQFVWSAATIKDAFGYKRGDVGDAGGRLRTWIQLEAMAPHGLSGLAVLAWKTAMRKKSATLKTMLTHEPGYQALVNYAPEDF
jgi:hypothetical protein